MAADLFDNKMLARQLKRCLALQGPNRRESPACNWA